MELHSEMYIRKRKSFRELCKIVRAIEADPDDLELVKDLNLRILDLVLESEQAIARHKDARKSLNSQLKTGRGDKKSSRALRTKIKMVTSYIKAQRDQVYIWKSFGDALTYIYLDSLSVKHAFFDTDDYEPRQDAGFLLGKKGLDSEVGFLNEAIENSVPAILCDLTNILRFGDVCLLGNSDPMLIEVKTSKRLNRRGQKQLAKLKQLHDFLDTDSATDFRGQSGPTGRVTLDVQPRYNLQEFNNCIAKAKLDGQAIALVEKGVAYLVVRRDGDIGTVIGTLGMTSPEVYDLNSYKNGYGWAPYTPFMLSIRDTEHLLDFIEGRLYIMIFVEPQHLCELMRGDGWEVRYRPDEQHSIQCLHLQTSAFVGLSSQFIARAGFEFMSLASIAEVQKQMLDHYLQHSAEFGGEIENSEYQRLLLEKFGPDDEWTRNLSKLDSKSLLH